jgi:hypothetical protein
MPAVLTWEDGDVRPAQANSSQDPISKIRRAKWTGGVAQAWSTCFVKEKPWVQTPVPQKRGKGLKIANRATTVSVPTIVEPRSSSLQDLLLQRCSFFKELRSQQRERLLFYGPRFSVAPFCSQAVWAVLGVSWPVEVGEDGLIQGWFLVNFFLSKNRGKDQRVLFLWAFPLRFSKAFEVWQGDEVHVEWEESPMLLFSTPHLVSFHCCDQTPEKINWKEKRFILAHSTQDFSPWPLG